MGGELIIDRETVACEIGKGRDWWNVCRTIATIALRSGWCRTLGDAQLTDSNWMHCTLYHLAEYA